MRLIHFAAFSFFLLALFRSAALQAAELQILAPTVVYNAGLKELADDFTKQTGTQVDIKVAEMLKIPGQVHSQPTDVFFLTPDLMTSLAPGEILAAAIPMGRVHIGLAVKAGAPHPDISTVAKLAAVLRAAKIGVTYSNPDPARGSMGAKIIDALLKRPEFAGVHGVISSKGNGVSGVINGEGDLGLQLESEILDHKEVELVGHLPDELKAHIDVSVAVSSGTADPAQAKSFVDFIMRPQATEVWKAKGMER
ncbi:MAG TPA: substrate-binding domain-containing protein [Rhizomicrobium sp.]|nr:substrate-binding domain-containing protein [Rhizomicrobium sp.]